MIGTKEGVVKAWAIRRKPEEEKWNKELILGMKGTPARPDPSVEGVEIPIKIRFPADEGREPT